MANRIAHHYQSAAPLRTHRIPALAYVGVTILIWAPIAFVIGRWLYP